MKRQKDPRKLREEMHRRSIGGSGEIPWVKSFRDLNKCVGELVGSETVMMIMFYSDLPEDDLITLVQKTTVTGLLRLLRIYDPATKNAVFAVARNRDYEFPFVDDVVEKLKATCRVLYPSVPEEPKNP